VADINKFGQVPDATPGGGGLRCEEWEALLADALDGVLAPPEAAAFDAHSHSCPACGDLLAHARQGQQWLVYLHEEPEVPAGLLGKIIDKTAAAGAMPVPTGVVAGRAAAPAAAALPWRRSFYETRVLMTVAMAFFSIALTLDMVGVRFNNIRLADLRPSTIGSTLSRQFYGARGQVVQFYQNLRFVYELESRMRQLRRSEQAQPSPAVPRKSAPSERNRNSNKDGLLNPGPGAVLNAQDPVSPGAGFHSPSAEQVSQTTEANHLNSLGQYRAGPRQSTESAGYEGRSLA
jgi:hypothetical protein